ncbi:MAG TPA: energy transducer TonB [Cyclobacteriaceae bacterium]|nr:energy transducer TonB [Cyclobacteriaceae bacterium]
MTRLLFSICILFHLTTLGQDLKKKRKGDETFYVLKSDESIRHGKYIRKSASGLIAKGQYEMNKRIGIWEFYGLDGNIEQKYNYSNKALLLNDNFTSVSMRNLIVRDGVTTETAPSQEPILVGGPSKYFRYLMKNLRYPSNARSNGTQGKVLVTAIITSDGMLKDTKVLHGLGDGCDEEALRVINSFESEWIPGKYNGEEVDTMIVLSIEFRLG